MRRLSAILLVMFCCNAAWPESAEHKGEAIVSRIGARSAGLRDFSARVEAKVQLSLLPSVTVAGKVYFKQPNHVKVTVDGLPRILERFRSEFGGLDPTRRNRSDYVTLWMRDDLVEGRPCWVLDTRPRQAGSNVQEVVSWVDQQTLTVPQARLRYADGSTVDTETTFEKVSQYLLPSRQNMRFHLTHVHCAAAMTYSQYALNRGLPDSIF